MQQDSLAGSGSRVSQGKDESLLPRDAEILAAARRGESREEIALRFGLSKARISQIVRQNSDPGKPQDDLRGWLLEDYFDDLLVLREIRDGPGRAMTSGKGDHVIDANTGQPAYDPSPKNEAVRTSAAVKKNIATLFGQEKLPPKPVEENQELATYIQHFERIMVESKQKDEMITQLQARLAAIEGAVDAHVVE